MESAASQAELLRRLHEGPGMLVLPNAWDAASARVFAAAGFPVVATTSGGVAAALGYKDHEDAPPDEVFAATARIARAVTIPVTADLEAGYRLPLEEVARRAIAAGAAGVNLEDSDHHTGAVLVEAESHAERLAAFKTAARAAGVDLVLNARVDVFIRRVGTPEEQLAEGIRRGRLYRQAGADCLYPIGLADEALLAAFVQAVGCPVNINVRRGVSLARLAAIGVRRASYATSLFREMLATVEQTAAEVKATVAKELGPA
ncbi:MAG: isocitrate lyase/phosphoenolpyruvate mutase family protein [Chloroflexi bacterium]|nr:isocitrate lyase/phosphoenolpyruvate mutase family protein [Chloroflexota bacterium]